MVFLPQKYRKYRTFTLFSSRKFKIRDFYYFTENSIKFSKKVGNFISWKNQKTAPLSAPFLNLFSHWDFFQFFFLVPFIHFILLLQQNKKEYSKQKREIFYSLCASFFLFHATLFLLHKIMVSEEALFLISMSITAIYRIRFFISCSEKSGVRESQGMKEDEENGNYMKEM